VTVGELACDEPLDVEVVDCAEPGVTEGRQDVVVE
jgi:hypothetical protein